MDLRNTRTSPINLHHSMNLEFIRACETFEAMKARILFFAVEGSNVLTDKGVFGIFLKERGLVKSFTNQMF